MNPSEIRQVWKNKSNGQKLVTVPKSSRIKEGDFVLVSRLCMQYDIVPANLQIQNLLEAMQEIMDKILEIADDTTNRYPNIEEHLTNIRYFRLKTISMHMDIQRKYVEDELSEETKENLEEVVEEEREEFTKEDYEQIEEVQEELEEERKRKYK